MRRVDAARDEAEERLCEQGNQSDVSKVTERAFVLIASITSCRTPIQPSPPLKAACRRDHETTQHAPRADTRRHRSYHSARDTHLQPWRSPAIASAPAAPRARSRTSPVAREPSARKAPCLSASTLELGSDACTPSTPAVKTRSTRAEQIDGSSGKLAGIPPSSCLNPKLAGIPPSSCLYPKLAGIPPWSCWCAAST